MNVYIPDLSGDALLWACGYALESDPKGRELVRRLPFLAIEAGRSAHDAISLSKLRNLTVGYDPVSAGDWYAQCPRTFIKVRACDPEQAIRRCFAASVLGSCWVDVPDEVLRNSED